MAPQQPTPPPTSANGGQVVTVTLFSTRSSGPSNLPASSGGGAKVPIGAIAGGVAGGVTLAVIMVLVWKYWGLVIKRTERQRRKEVQNILTVRENTRRNAMTKYKPKPQSPLRPILNLNEQGPRVKFLTRTPTSPRGKNNINNTNISSNNNNVNAAPAAIPPPTEEMRVVNSEALTTESGTDEAWQPSPSFASTIAPLIVHGAELEQNSESAEQQPEGEATITSPPLPGPAPSPGPSRSHSPTPSHAASTHSSSSPRPSRSTRMRMPTRLPDPPAAPPIPIRGARTHHARPSVSTPSTSQTSVSPLNSRLPAAGSRYVPETPGTLAPRSTSSVPAVTPALVAGPSTVPSPPSIPLSVFTSTNSPLRHSVLPSYRPVIMPRPKSVGATSPSESHPSSPTSTWGHAPMLPSSASQVSAGSGEPSARHGYPDSLSHGRPPTETADENAHNAFASSRNTPSAYSND